MSLLISHAQTPRPRNRQCCGVPPLRNSNPPSKTIPQVRESIFVFVIRLSYGAPDVLEETVPLREPVEGVVALADGSDEAAEGVDDVLAGDGAAVLVNLGDGDLDGGVILGLDDAVGGAALAGDIAVGKIVSVMNLLLNSHVPGYS